MLRRLGSELALALADLCLERHLLRLQLRDQMFELLHVTFVVADLNGGGETREEDKGRRGGAQGRSTGTSHHVENYGVAFGKNEFFGYLLLKARKDRLVLLGSLDLAAAAHNGLAQRFVPNS